VSRTPAHRRAAAALAFGA